MKASVLRRVVGRVRSVRPANAGTLARRVRRLGAVGSTIEGAVTESVIGRSASIAQDDDSLTLELTFHKDVRAEALVARVEDSWHPLASLAPPDGADPAAPLYRARVPLEALARPDQPPGPHRVELYVDLNLPAASARRLEHELEAPLLVTPGTRPSASRGSYRLRLGRFRATSFSPVVTTEVNGRRLTAYPDADGHVMVGVDLAPEPYAEVYVKRLSAADGRLAVRGRVETFHGDVLDATLVLRGRLSAARFARRLDLRLDEAATRANFGLHVYRFDLAVDWTELLDQPDLRDDLLDAVLEVRTVQDPELLDVRVGKTKFLARHLTRGGVGERPGLAAMLTPYYTFKGKRTSFQLDLFEPDNLRYLRFAVRTRRLLRWGHTIRRGRPVWLVGEKPDKAQDTGLAFFRYLREEHPEIDAYYVINPDSPELDNVKPLGNVLPIRSKEHIRATMLAERVVGSHHPDFLYPVRTRGFRRTVRAARVFLQHGVMGTKWMVPNYGKSASDFETDLFLVSSEREKQYIVSDFGYKPDEVAVTGLSRFDQLLAPDTPVRRQLLVLPTWRDWLTDGDAYLESQYHARWHEFLHDPRLHDLARRHDLDIVFSLHPNMQQFIALFSDAPVRVISQGDADVQQLMKESAVLLTDYSSVGFDFSFLHRPVLYYQFDQERFLGPRGSHLDLDTELPGPILFTDADVFDALEALAGNEFHMDPLYVARSDRFLSHRDRHNNERIFEATRRARAGNTWLRRVSTGSVAESATKALRRSPAYFPAMRFLLRTLQRFPADDNLVVFESGVGKQYADSPRYVYEELVRRGSDMRKVWVYSGKIHHADPRTTIVERLSPAYYWHLGRARYWVNNQNFPHYVHRRPNGVYVQTWHGTPLKRMLHDLDVVVGRDSGYLARVTTAAGQWSLLTSPSAWATDRMRSAFRYKGPVVEVGYPRNDLLLAPDRDEVRSTVRRRLGIPPHQTVVLYAPTFRDDQAVGASRFDFRLPLDLPTLAATLGDDVTFLIRLHGLVQVKLEIPEELARTVKDVSAYPEIQELFIASDALVTDYSSVFFDFAALRRPMVFYAYDLDAYRDELRGFYLDYERDLPGPIVTTEKDLYETLGSLDEVEAEYLDRYDAFVRRFLPHDDGQAAARVTDEMLALGGAVARRRPHRLLIRRRGR